MNQITPENLTYILSAIVSILFMYFPKLESWYDTLPSNEKRLVMTGALAVIAIAVYGLACSGYLDKVWPGAVVACNEEGLIDLVKTFVIAVGVNQGVYRLAKRD